MHQTVRHSEGSSEATVTRWERAYFAAVGLSALWIGFWGYFLPAIQKSIPFPIPPLHARFLGAMYLSAFVLLWLGFRGQHWSEITVVPVMTAVWTTGIFLVSLLHAELFNFARVTTWIWFVAYGVYPVVAVWLVWRHRQQILAVPDGGNVPASLRTYFLVQGTLLTALSVALFLAPDTMAGLWPWAITFELARLYFAPFLAFGLGSLLLGRIGDWHRLRAGVVTLTVFFCGVLTASLLHRSLFSGAERPDQLWFALLAVASVVQLVVSVRSLRHG